jgi:hypothetical protein
MPAQPQLSPRTESPPEPSGREASGKTESHAAPVWLQRLSLCVLVMFCLYVGVMMTILPWWTRMWDHNRWLETRPQLAAVMQHGAVRGLITGLGLLDIWIGVSEAIHYRDYRG